MLDYVKRLRNISTVSCIKISESRLIDDALCAIVAFKICGIPAYIRFEQTAHAIDEHNSLTVWSVIETLEAWQAGTDEEAGKGATEERFRIE